MQVDISYDTAALIGAVGPSAWAKLGPEDWFENYKIIAANSRGYDLDFIYDLKMKADDLELPTTENIVNTDMFAAVALRDMAKYKFIVYKPLHSSGLVDIDRFIANDISYSCYENKKYFRETFVNTLPIPNHIFVAIEEFLSADNDEQMSSLINLFGVKFVVQDSLNGGGRGTFVISSVQDLAYCKDTLTNEKLGTHVVISQFIEGIERSIQVFVSKQAVIRGPLQQQLVRNPELLNPSGRGGMFFCGGRFLKAWDEQIEEQLTNIVHMVSLELASKGYKGICGIDFLLDAKGKLWVLEINARTTGLLPLLNEQKSQYPLYLLHILEIARIPYRLTTKIANTTTSVNGPESFVVLFNQSNSVSYFDDTIETGNYQFRKDKLIKLDNIARWNQKADCMLQLFATKEFPSKPNSKLANVFLRNGGFIDSGELQNDTKELIAYLKSRTIRGVGK